MGITASSCAGGNDSAQWEGLVTREGVGAAGGAPEQRGGPSWGLGVTGRGAVEGPASVGGCGAGGEQMTLPFLRHPRFQQK